VYSKLSRAVGLTAVAVGLGVIAVPASAQQAAFHLPFEAHWGSALLEPGDYRISIPTGESPSHIVHLFGAGKGSMVIPESTEIRRPTVDHSSLELVNVKGTYFVREYKSAPTGQVFTFGVPKSERELTTVSSIAAAVPVEDATK
jgi:hypothetical protein